MRVFRLLPAAAIAAGVLASAAPAGALDIDVIADGLDNPRHVAVDRAGDVWVAEAGTGGPETGPGASCMDTPEGFACTGDSGAVTRVRNPGGRNPRADRVVTGLASFAPPPGSENAGHNAIGPHGIASGGSRMFITNGGPLAPLREDVVVPRFVLAGENPVARLFGKVLRVPTGGGSEPRRVRVVADAYAFEAANNIDITDGNPLVDSNPVDVLADRGELTVADAGANTLLRWTDDSHEPDVAALFENVETPNPFGGPAIQMNAVPTAVVARGSSYYVSQLTGFPFPVGGARIFRVDRRTGEITPMLEGNFTNIIDIAFDGRGRLYVLEIDHDSLLTPLAEGALFRVTGTTVERLDEPGELTNPGGIDVAGGTLYVSNRATQPGTGELLRIRP